MPFWIQTKIEQAKTACERILHSPFGMQLFVLTFFVFFLSGFRPSVGWGETQGFGVEFGLQNNEKSFPLREEGFIAHPNGVQTLAMEEVIIKNEDGTEKSILRPKKREKMIEYVIRSGDTIPKIAFQFGLQVRSILWANNLTLADDLELGKTLKIPPMDGVYYAVQKGDTLSDIATQHGLTSEIVITQNGLSSSQVLKIGQELFLPNAQRVFIAQKEEEPEPTTPAKPQNGESSKQSSTLRPPPKKTYAKTTPKSASNGQKSPTSASVGRNIANLGYKILRPTKGVLTQGYHGGHLALDIAAGMNTPIYASAPGKVIISQDGWNGGYGRYIILDHGNGVQTLYAHNNVRKVAVGDYVSRGELIALMGNTGRVFGRTGIHLHFELRINGRKVRPSSYF